MRFFRYLALVIFFLDLPVPIYWFILHPFGKFWRHRVRAAFWFAGLSSWIAGGVFVAVFHRRLIADGAPSITTSLLGVMLIAADFILLYSSGRRLGHLKLVGHSELTGKTELTTGGIYKYVRHPRYSGMIAAIAGACLLAGTKFGWIVGAVWLACVLTAILLEEREMRARFGPAYEVYSLAVPRFLPKIPHA